MAAILPGRRGQVRASAASQVIARRVAPGSETAYRALVERALGVREPPPGGASIDT
ncbi:hypothetical protein GCM10027053_07700 [Intrasporangium mesophilum]